MNMVLINSINQVSKNLINAHILEAGKGVVSLNHAHYKQFSKAVFVIGKKQVGYIAFIIQKDSHYDKLVYQDICYFILKEYRLKYAKKMFELVKEFAKNNGCKAIKLHCIRRSQLNFFLKQGYKLSDYSVEAEV